MTCFFRYILTACMVIAGISCNKFVETEQPNNQIIPAKVFASDNTANAAVAGMYSFMYNNTQPYLGYLSLYTALSADEGQSFNNSFNEFYTNSIPVLNSQVANIWNQSYHIIYQANAIMEGLGRSNSVAPALQKQLTGEAYFIRAFCYFYLVNLFGDLPLVLTTDVEANKFMSRIDKDKVYDQIVSDLKEAILLLAPDYRYSAGERVRANKWAATALLAKVHLYRKEWEDAEARASEVIGSGLYSLVANPATVFYKNSKESIWQFMATAQAGSTYIGALTIAASPTAAPLYVLSSTQLAAFEADDRRMANWVRVHTYNSQTYYSPYKYKVRTAVTGDTGEYDMVLRLAEQYLLRAEARTHQNNLGGAIEDLDSLRNRAGVPLLKNINPGIQKDDLLMAIEKEGRTEMFFEWGYRWLTLKRTGRANAVLANKPGWKSHAVLYPVPQIERSKNPNLSQNEGYQ